MAKKDDKIRKSSDPDFILNKIKTLVEEIKGIQNKTIPADDYKGKVKELMYWRRRQTQVGKKRTDE